MRLLCLGTWPAIDRGYFRLERPDPLQREVHAGALLGTLLSVRRDLWLEGLGHPAWKHVNKAGTLPYLSMGVGMALPWEKGGYARMIENCKAAFDTVRKGLQAAGVTSLISERGWLNYITSFVFA